MVAGYALRTGVDAKSLITASAPADMDFIVEGFCAMVGASERLRQGLLKSVEEILEAPYHEASLNTNPLLQEVAGMIIHDRNDRIVPYGEADRINKAWPSACRLSTKGLGHNRTLKNIDVVKQIVHYLQKAPYRTSGEKRPEAAHNPQSATNLR